MQKGNLRKTVTYTTLIMAIEIALVTAVIYTGVTLKVEDKGFFSRQVASDIISVGFLFGAMIGMIFLATLIANGIRDRLNNVPFSPLFWPFVLLANSILITVMFTAAQAFDYILHDRVIQWNLGAEPEIRLINVFVVLGGVFGSIGWFIWTLQTRRGIQPKTLILSYSGIVLLALSLILFLVLT